MNTFSLVANIVGIATGLLSVAIWIQTLQIRKFQEDEQERLNQPITVELRSGNRTIDLPVKLRRRELTRGEVLGLIGMIPLKDTGQNRFNPIKYTSTSVFFERLHKILDGDMPDTLTINCSDEEFDQFDPVSG